MTEGTKSYLFGCHQFFLHPLWILFAWRLEYGSWPRLWEIICIFLHDVGICGRQYMSDDEAKAGHWQLGGVIAQQFFLAWGLPKIARRSFDFIAGHCPHESGFPKSMMFRPDKRSYLVAPMWWKWWNYWVEGFKITNPVVWTELVRENLESEVPMEHHELYLSSKEPGREHSKTEKVIVNVIDTREFDKYLASPSGQKAVLNVLSPKNKLRG